MNKIDKIKNHFIEYGGVLKTSELNGLGFSSRQIKKLMEEGIITKIKYGFYELTDYIPREEVIIARLFPESIIFLESALFYYGYTDRIPSSWQIAVNKNSSKLQYNINYPLIKPYYLEPKFIEIGIDIIEIEGVEIRIYDRDRTICDVLRYETKLEEEVFTNAIKKYIKDPKKNVRNIFEYAEIFNIRNKVQTYIGVWL
ncbi:MAG: Transcriptional regulator, AbiEi antitoxin, Type IV TA system [Xylanivirga thermophila]|jgi:predicted transcriptional regulator of viral defense system|uniref:type IV toxin-antitoxin system AbiEi family antitoxin domain-containing protein n=1 Tax=Xylanivirga thermophila TaxID=2496273 RepID=UPI0039F60763